MDQDKNSTKKSIYLPLILGICTAIGLVVGLNIPRYDSEVALFQNRGGGGSNNLLSEVVGFIDAKYVDNVDSLGFDEAAINQLLEKLDPHTTYLSPDALVVAQEEMDGAFKGIGIEFLMINDTLQVVSPLAGGPAEIAGIWSGDQFIRVDDTLIAGVNITDKQLYHLLRGEKGTSVRIAVRRAMEDNLRIFEVIRDEIPVHSITSAYALDAETAYVKLSRFNHNTHQEFVEALLPQAKDKANINLVLDLRGNPGGLLDQAIQVLSDVFPEGKLLVYTQGRADKKHEYKSSGRVQVNIDRLVVLLDEGSASASEVVAGAVQDHDRGWIVGSRSFGKGLVQEQYPLSNGGAIRVTVSRYYTPSGRCIQKDFSNRTTYKEEHLHRDALDTLQHSVNGDTAAYYTGLGRKVYSGSGIQPDVVINESAVEASALFGRVRSMVPSFTAKWMEGKNKASIADNEKAFAESFQVSAEHWANFQVYAKLQGLNITATDWQTVEEKAKLDIKASIARSLFGVNGFQLVKNSHDPVVKEALKLIREKVDLHK